MKDNSNWRTDTTQKEWAKRELERHADATRAQTSLEQELMDASPIALPTTPLGEIAELLREAQKANMSGRLLGVPPADTANRNLINDKLTQARILVDVLREGRSK